MFKFLHAADIHLDSPLRGLERYDGCPADDVRRSARRAFANLVDLGIAESVAFVLIAGDLYDGDHTDFSACLFLQDQTLRLRDAGIPVFLIRGNHDAESQMTRHLKMPDNVKSFPTDQAGSFTLEKWDVAIHGQGFATRAVTENLANRYPRADPGLFNIGLLHTCVEGREGHDAYAPCSLADLKARGYGYWALGHIHQYELLANEPPIVFAGNLQGRHVRETGSKGAVLVEVDRGEVTRMSHRSLDVMRWAVEVVDASGAKTEDDLIERARDRFAALASDEGRLPTAVRVEFRGPCQAHHRLADRARAMEAGVRAMAREVGGGRLWVEKVKTYTQPEKRFESPEASIRLLMDHLDAVRDDHERLAAMGRELMADLKKKLPACWSDGSGRLAVDDPVRLREALNHVAPELLNGLTESGSTPS